MAALRAAPVSFSGPRESRRFPRVTSRPAPAEKLWTIWDGFTKLVRVSGSWSVGPSETCGESVPRSGRPALPTIPSGRGPTVRLAKAERSTGAYTTDIGKAEAMVTSSHRPCPACPAGGGRGAPAFPFLRLTEPTVAHMASRGAYPSRKLGYSEAVDTARAKTCSHRFAEWTSWNETGGVRCEEG